MSRIETDTRQLVHVAYVVREFKRPDGTQDDHWAEIGATFPHKDGLGLELVLTSVPLDGRIVLRSVVPAESQGYVASLQPG